jgi:hypothetical protein
VALQVIGVQLDQPRRQQVAAEIDAAFRCAACANFSYLRANDRNPAFHDSVRQNNPRVLDDQASAHGGALKV